MDRSPHPGSCQCLTCARMRRNRKRYRVAYEQGLRNTSDVDDLRAHLVRLRQCNIGVRAVERATGVPKSTLSKILTGEIRRVTCETARAVLAFAPDDTVTAPGCLIDATATRLRCQALIALGYTREYIASHTGPPGTNQLRVGGRIRQWRALAVLELCRQIGDTPGPSQVAADRARSKGWRVPADYDEDLFYDPAWDGSEPEEVTPLPRRQIYLEEYELLSSAGIPLPEIARRLGISPEYLRDKLLGGRDRTRRLAATG